MVARVRLNPSHTRKCGVNYRKPPKDKQFKPGQSGNPSGRPKGVRNFETDLREMLKALVEVRKAGGVRRITLQQASLHVLAEKALNGDQRANEHLIGLILRYTESKGEPPVVELDGNDRAILDEYCEERKALEAKNASLAAPNPSMADKEASS